ncbi:GNAT family N-acetyltransferase [Streptomyces sp. NA04227]|uniref:GNAT family N-acetyltransferase n=1 Tax=Streptomyces sp. NA04227 TaxID=2742136 RepID=UPI00158FBA92|nr:GNAT family N-acetyltransferase [Streptomyces sp. NA04227]QKW09142.1 GNAT family N-acetyltransferase [Streptomyces sp. NA04227]
MGVTVRRAEESDRAAVVRLLDEAFHDDPVSNWIFPDKASYQSRHRLLMGAFTDLAFSQGYVEIMEDGSGAALWFSVPAEEERDGHAPDAGADGGPEAFAEDDGPALVREAVDPANQRIEVVGRLTAAVHPADRAHEYLMLIGVDPDQQGKGLGSVLVEHVLERCDREGLHAYLEASSVRSRGLYERLGFAYLGSTVDLPGGPHMWPMWREPRAEPGRA